MLRNYFIIALRNIWRHKTFSAINIIGLAVSMSLGMLIIMILKDQFSFDNFHKDSDRIYRVNTLVNHPDWGKVDFASTPLSVGKALKDEYSFTENVVRVSRQLYGDATYLNVNVSLKGLLVDQSFPGVFNFPFLKGDPATALSSPNSLVITKQTAGKIFGTIEPIGQIISIKGMGNFTITGVLQEFPGKTHFEFEMLCSMSTLPLLERNKTLNPSLDNWSTYYNNYVYIKLKDGHNAKEAEQALAEINKKYCIGLQWEGRDIAYDSFYLQPLNKITPGPELAGKMGKGLPSPFLVFLGVLAGVVLLMSVFNFTNLAIAKSLSRAREIGVRKVMGADRKQVFFQFIGEAVVFSFVALAFSYILLQFLKTGLSQLSLSQDFFMDLKEDFSLYIIFILFAIGVGLLAGVLPASYLSAFKPAKVLKDVQNLKIYSRLTLRKILMVVQFTLSVIFVIVVLVIYRQVDFMLTADYGIQQKNNLNLDLQGASFEKLANEIRSVPGVISVGGVSDKLGTFENGTGDYKKNKSDRSFVMSQFMVDDNYIKNLSLTFLSGHNFSPPDQAGKEKDVILNETASTHFGFKQPADAIGETLYANDTLSLRIIGVVRDFHFRPLSNKIGPLALRYNIRELRYLSANIYPSQKESAIASIKTIWKKHDPVHPVQLMMMDREIDDAYRETGLKDMPVMVGYIAFLIVSLACLGMIGMTMYASQVRVKEVGIRKVLGASVTNMVILLGKSYLVLIGVAILIGVPVSFMLGQIFLEEYPYRIQITPLLLAFGVLIIAALGLLTVGSQTLKVAISNPVKSLRTE